MWLWVAGLAGLASATDSFLNRLALKERSGDVPGYTLVYFFLISLFLIPFCYPFDLVSLNRNLPLVILQGIFWSMATVAGYMARAKTHVSIQTILGQSRIIWVTALAVFFLAEKVTGLTVAGIGVIFLGLIMLFYQSEVSWHRGMTLTALAAFFAAIGSILNAILVRGDFGVFQASFTMVASQLPVLFLLFLFKGKNEEYGFGEVLTQGALKETIGFGRRVTVKHILRTRWKLLFGATIMEALAVVGINWAYRTGPSAPATAVFMAVSVMTAVALGIILLHERESIGRKILSSAVILAGVVILKFANL